MRSFVETPNRIGLKIYLISYWQLSSNQTSTNRMLAFKNSLEAKGYELFFFSHKDSGKIYQDTARNRFRDAITSRLDNSFIRFFYELFILLFKRKERLHVADFYQGSLSLADVILHPEDIIITSAPPSGMFGIGAELKESFACRWISDYRDPWTYGYRLPPFDSPIYGLKRRLYRKEENRYLALADALTIVSQSLRKYYPKAIRRKMQVVGNGANLEAMDLNRIQDRPKKFSILYSGTIYTVQLQEPVFFRVLRQFLSDHLISPEHFQLVFLGSAETPYLSTFIEQEGLKDYTIITKRLGTKEAMEYMYKSSLFLHLRYGKTGDIITSKIYDYLALQKKILLPVSDKGDLETILNYYQSGIICSSEKEIYQAIQNAYQAYLDGESCRCERTDQELLELSREFQTEGLADLIRTLAGATV